MKAHGVTTTATVVSLHTGKAFYYTVRFSLPNGRTITADTGEANDKSVLVDGDPIQVEYLPEDPTDVDQVGTLGSQSIIWTGFVVFGLLLFVVAVALLTPLRHFLVRGSTGSSVGTWCRLDEVTLKPPLSRPEWPFGAIAASRGRARPALWHRTGVADRLMVVDGVKPRTSVPDGCSAARSEPPRPRGSPARSGCPACPTLFPKQLDDLPDEPEHEDYQQRNDGPDERAAPGAHSPTDQEYRTGQSQQADEDHPFRSIPVAPAPRSEEHGQRFEAEPERALREYTAESTAATTTAAGLGAGWSVTLVLSAGTPPGRESSQSVVLRQ